MKEISLLDEMGVTTARGPVNNRQERKKGRPETMEGRKK